MTAEHWFALLLTLECVAFLAFDLWRSRRQRKRDAHRALVARWRQGPYGDGPPS